MAEEKFEGQVKGMKEAMSQAEKGLALLEAEKEAPLEFDTDAAAAYKSDVDAEITKIQEEEAKLTGKDNKKARSELGKKVMNMKNDPKYVDACKAAKGNPPIHGHFLVGVVAEEKKAQARRDVHGNANEVTAEAGKDKKDDKKKEKKQESAGISRAEKDELESLKNQIIDRKKALKEQGMSGGQMNKDEEIVKWVARMNELKEKECPGSTGKDAKKEGEGKKKKTLSAEAEKNLLEKKQAFEEYTEKLRSEFKYSKKEIAADPDYQEMLAEINKIEKGK